MAISKQAVITYEGVPRKVLIVEPGQKMWKVHTQTHKAEEIPLPYDKTAVPFEMDYFYCPAINKETALKKFNKDQKEQEFIKKRQKLN